jgi:hypothetical protein
MFHLSLNLLGLTLRHITLKHQYEIVVANSDIKMGLGTSLSTIFVGPRLVIFYKGRIHIMSVRHT